MPSWPGAPWIGDAIGGPPAGASRCQPVPACLGIFWRARRRAATVGARRGRRLRVVVGDRPGPVGQVLHPRIAAAIAASPLMRGGEGMPLVCCDAAS